VILETRRIRGGLLGFSGKERVEILADVDDSPKPVESMPEPSLEEIQSLFKSHRAGRREAVASLFADSGISESLALELIAAGEPNFTESALVSQIIRHLRVSPILPTGSCTRVALVGPTGVGKTTTVAKLAARYSLTERKQVGLITMDTYRIGAVEQLKTYARVMGLPIEVAQTPEEMALAVSRFRDKDLVLIDTIGRSPQKSLHLAEIKSFLNAAEPTETHLVLSAPCGLGYLFQTAERFSMLGTNRLIITKLDEMPRWGVIASLVDRTGLPVSFLTDGQEVPRNLRSANADEIAMHILGGAE
jgi:flagellar biosynthesis protein FlhF